MARKAPEGHRSIGLSKPVESARPGPRLKESWVVGPTLLAVLISVEGMIWLWRTFYKRTPDPEVLKRYTSVALQLFQLDYDKPIYLGGALFCLIFASTVYLLWVRRLRSPGHETLQFQQAVLFGHFHGGADLD